MEGKIEFAVFCIENLAERLGIDGSAAYRLLAEQTDVLNGYILPCYDVLHTQGKEYIVDDLIEVLREKGAVA